MNLNQGLGIWDGKLLLLIGSYLILEINLDLACRVGVRVKDRDEGSM
jgi:hypothetical protein